MENESSSEIIEYSKFPTNTEFKIDDISYKESYTKIQNKIKLYDKKVDIRNSEFPSKINLKKVSKSSSINILSFKKLENKTKYP